MNFPPHDRIIMFSLSTHGGFVLNVALNYSRYGIFNEISKKFEHSNTGSVFHLQYQFFFWFLKK